MTVAVVTGASRGAGRGIALALGDTGATVYVTGRSARGGATTENRPETVDETADLVTKRGGRGIAVRCDHTDESEVDALIDRVEQNEGRLDLLVNNAWGGYEGYDERFAARFWRQPFEQRWRGMFEAGLRASLLTTHRALRLMLPKRKGLIVSTVWWHGGDYLGNLFYDVSKAAIVRASESLAIELRLHNIAVIAVAPGFMRTEKILDALGDDPDGLARTESPEYVGRGIAALAADRNVLERTGEVYFSGELAAIYDFDDVDGRRVPPFETSWRPCADCAGAECERCGGLGQVLG